MSRHVIQTRPRLSDRGVIWLAILSTIYSGVIYIFAAIRLLKEQSAD